jgi:hypothetical protein
MAWSKGLLIGIGLGLVIISFVVYSYMLNHNNPETTKSTSPVSPSNETQITANVHHYQVKVNEFINVAERTR